MCWNVGGACQDGCMFKAPCALRLNLALPLSRVKEAFDRLTVHVIEQYNRLIEAIHTFGASASSSNRTTAPSTISRISSRVLPVHRFQKKLKSTLYLPRNL